MKRYTIGLILLLALISTGCEDAKAESKDYDVEIAELQQQITQLSNLLDSTISVIPKKYNYEGIGDAQGNVVIDIPSLNWNDLPVISFAKNVANGMIINEGSLRMEEGKVYLDNDVSPGNTVKVQIIK